MNNFSIRVEEERDYRAVESLVRESFWNVYRPGCTEHYVLHHLRSNPDFIPELAFVMEADGKIIGQNIFVKAQITKDDAGFRMKWKSGKQLSQGTSAYGYLKALTKPFLVDRFEIYTQWKITV